MAVSTNTKKADEIVIKDDVLEKIKKEFISANSAKLLESIHKLEVKLKKIYYGESDIFAKIENKPFYYFTKGGFYIADPQRCTLTGSGSVPTGLENVSTTYMTYAQFGELFQFHYQCPIYSGYNSEGFKIIKNNNEFMFIAGSNGYNYSSFGIYDYGKNYSYWNSVSRQEDVSKNSLRLPIAKLRGVCQAVQNNLMPSELSDEEKALFKLLVNYSSHGWLCWNNDSIEKFSAEFDEALKKDSVEDFGDICFKEESLIKHIKDSKYLQSS